MSDKSNTVREHIERAVTESLNAYIDDYEATNIYIDRAIDQATRSVEELITKAVIDRLEKIQAKFGDRGIITFDMPYNEEAETVAIANVLNKITEEIADLKSQQQS
jgi:hypothetical protein